MSWLDRMPQKTLRLRAKRALDVAASAGGLAILSPVLLATTGAVTFAMGFPPWFLQARPGLHGRSFTMIKLRTMNDRRDAEGRPLPDAERLTSFGRFLRSTSLDELPELLNVLAGDMSLVGPRPLLPEYLPRYSARQGRRHEMPPGITGWAQVHGRNALGWDEKFELDVWYVEHYSFALDLLILFRTIQTVLVRDGISGNNEATMAPFIGTEPPLP